MEIKINDKYQWTKHSIYKMRHYGLSEQRIKRVIRYPSRTEEAIIPGMIAAMKPAGLATEALAKAAGKKYSEIWTIYKPVKSTNTKYKIQNTKYNQIKIITAWRYPGKSLTRNPIPKEILEEIKNII